MLGLLSVGLGLEDGIPDDPVCAQMLDTRFWRPLKLCVLETTDFALRRPQGKKEVTIEGTETATLSSMIRIGENHWGAFLVADDAQISNLRLVITVDTRFDAVDSNANIVLEPFIAYHDNVGFASVEICVIDHREDKKGRPVVYQNGKYQVVQDCDADGKLESQEYQIRELDTGTGQFTGKLLPATVYRSPSMATDTNVYRQLYAPENTYDGYAQLYQRLFGYAKIYYKGTSIETSPKLDDPDTNYYYQSKYGAMQLDFEGARVKDIRTAKYFRPQYKDISDT